MRWKPLIRVLLPYILIIGVVLVYLNARPMLAVATGYKAKTLCSETFLVGRDFDEVLAAEFRGMPTPIQKAKAYQDRSAQSVTSSFYNIVTSKAIYREGYGCTLTDDGFAWELPRLPVRTKASNMPEEISNNIALLDRIDGEAIARAADQHFADPIADTRALLVMVDGEVVFERYAPGFDQETKFISWSMAKSVIATLIGIAEMKEQVDIQKPISVREWHDDPRKQALTWDNLLKMESGLEFKEAYGGANSDVTQMLFNTYDNGERAAQKPLKHTPGAVFNYSSGTTNLLARTLRFELEKNRADIYGFAQSELFEKIGADSFVMEPDASGTPIGSSYMYATMRDWARLGQLYLQDGTWNGERLLPEGWADYVSTPTQASNGLYGAHFWTNQGPDDHDLSLPGLPDDYYRMSGHEGQYVFIIPDKNMIVVRTGMTRNAKALRRLREVMPAIYGAVNPE